MRQSRWLAAFEITLFIGVIVADQYHLVPLSNTPFLFALAWMFLRLRGQRWRDVGFTPPRRWLPAIAIGIAAGIATELLAIHVTEPFIARLVGNHPDVSDLRPLVGNLKLLLALIVPMWFLAAFGEEMVYRGYLMNRLAFASLPVALLASSTVFGFAHAEGQGVAGVLQEGFSGLILGLLYLRSGRTLAVPIIAHGTANTLAFVLIYMNRYPGL